MTDHRNLQTIMMAKQLNQRQIRWAEFLSQFNFSITYRPGNKAALPDACNQNTGRQGRCSAVGRVNLWNPPEKIIAEEGSGRGHDNFRQLADDAVCGGCGKEAKDLSRNHRHDNCKLFLETPNGKKYAKPSHGKAFLEKFGIDGVKNIRDSKTDSKDIVGSA